MTLASWDLVIVGAGAAGLAAARVALACDLTVLVLEAKDRIGGRAHTDRATFGFPWDRGAHWLHQARTNPFTAFAEAEGFAYDQLGLPRRLWSGGGPSPRSRRARGLLRARVRGDRGGRGGWPGCRGLDRDPAAPALSSDVRIRGPRRSRAPIRSGSRPSTTPATS